MLTVKINEYYSKTKNILNTLSDGINNIKSNVPREEEKYIVSTLLQSILGDNGIDYIYKVPHGRCQQGELIKHYMDKFTKFKNEFMFKDFYKQVIYAESSFDDLCNEYKYEDNNIRGFINKLNELLDLHQNLVISSYDTDNKMLFFNKAIEIIDEYDFIDRMISNFINITMDEKRELQDNEKIISLQLLDVKYNVREFSEILEHIDNAYSSLSSFFKESNGNLEILKIESGSLFLEAVGQNIVAGLVCHLIVSIAKIIYNSFKNHKTEFINKEINAIKDSALTMEKLEELGIHVDKDNKKALGECLAHSINELKKVVLKAPKIKIDGEVYGAADAISYLEASRKLLDVKVDDKESN